MKISILALLICLSSIGATGQDLKAYQIYNKKGEKVTFGEMMEKLSEQEIVLFGEYHDVSILHWLQLKTTEALYEKRGDELMLGAEMFERDNQDEIDRYLSGELTEKEFGEQARLWSNFKTDYKPLLDFSKTHDLSFIATNVPRRYAQIVAKFHLDSLGNLSEKEKVYIAELPIKVDLKTPGYEEMKKMMEPHAGENAQKYIDAQAIKDATMAESILEHRERKTIFLHFNGDYHSKEYGGIYWYLKKQKRWLENLKIAVISVVQSEQVHLPLPEDFTPTEFNIVFPEDMTKTSQR